jgi:hypothetical protein
MIDREFWLQVRQALLMVVDAIEKYVLGIRPTTKECRDKARDHSAT